MTTWAFLSPLWQNSCTMKVRQVRGPILCIGPVRVRIRWRRELLLEGDPPPPPSPRLTQPRPRSGCCAPTPPPPPPPSSEPRHDDPCPSPPSPALDAPPKLSRPVALLRMLPLYGSRLTRDNGV